jgi:hypothetical protein
MATDVRGVAFSVTENLVASSALASRGTGRGSAGAPAHRSIYDAIVRVVCNKRRNQACNTRAFGNI